MPEPPPLWSDAFLADEIREQPEYQALDDNSAEFDRFVSRARQILGDVHGIKDAAEQLTIERAITPLLEALGWPTPLPQLGLTARDEVDLALYAEGEQREALLRDSERDQVLGAAGIVECKAWDSPFDTSGSGSRPGETAAQQLQRYLLIAGADSGETLRWGILTNGARWRIYSYRARPRERAWEIDLDRLLVSQDLFDQQPNGDKLHQLRLAWLLLRRDSWVDQPGENESFLDRLLNEGRRADEQVAANLSGAIFKDVYPQLVAAFWRRQPEAAADDVARAALYFLYRLLFLSYAEDRGLLPVGSDDYAPVSLRHAVRDRVSNGHAYPERSTTLWDAIETLRDMVDQGDEQLGVPAYDGRLFAPIHKLLDEIKVPDAELAPIIAPLSHVEQRYISYRTLSVQQLGSIYEKLLEFVPQRDDAGQVETVLRPYARKDSGSYYTPQELVDLIVEQTLRPLVEERIAAFRDDPRAENDPALAVRELKVLDPAMGSGHFLITALDWLADRIMELLDTTWEHDPAYESPLRDELAQVRRFITQPPDLPIDNPAIDVIERNRAMLALAEPPDDRAIVQRMVLKRCIYGVDKNPLAVELARVALWLHTFTPPLPLPYLNHRIRAGDSLLGISFELAVEYLGRWGPDHMARGLWNDKRMLLDAAEMYERGMTESLDLVLPGIQASERAHEAMETASIGTRRAFDLLAGFRWLSAGMKKRDRDAFHEPLTDALSGHVGRAVAILYNGENREGLTPSTPEFREIRDRARAVIDREHIFHWEVEFPQVFDAGGFDAVISNPPWDQVEQSAIEWFAAREPEIALAKPASRQKTLIAAKLSQRDEIADQYEAAMHAQAGLRRYVRTIDTYKLVSAGRPNLYKLFVGRALALLHPHGIAGLLVPSGIYADKSVDKFFRSISTTGRLCGIYDFRNTRAGDPTASSSRWFADVGDNEKFSAIIIGGEKRDVAEAKCGFFLAGRQDLKDPERVFVLTPRDFARLNPNTGTAPIFRTRRDANIVTRIYQEHPTLADRSSGEELRAWNVRFKQGLFNMTSDSDCFSTAEQLEDTGSYRVAQNRFRKGSTDWVSLLQGRSIHYFDHRANGIEISPKGIRQPYRSVASTDLQRESPEFTPAPQYWVEEAEVVRRFGGEREWAIAFRNVARITDRRTMIAALVPRVGIGHGLPLLLGAGEFTAKDAAYLLANLNSIPFDYVTRCKIAGANLTWYNIEQLPVIAPADYDRAFGETSARELVRDHVLRLSYTAHDLEPFARDLGYEGDPFIWNPAERRQLRARLDALYFHLYGLDEDDTAYILDQFPVLEKNERKAHGRYLTKELVLGYHRALAAGDTESEIRLD